jgi:hypothetical protein
MRTHIGPLGRAWCASLLVGAIAPLGCATPPELKEASAAQVDLIWETEKSLQAIRKTILTERPRIASDYGDRLQEVRDAPSLEAALNVKLAALDSELEELQATDGRPPVASSEPASLSDVVAAGNELQFVEVLSLQLVIMRRASTVIDRYLATDVFGDEQVEQTYELITEARGALQ